MEQYQQLLFWYSTHLDLIVGTHSNEDHIGIVPDAFNYIDADIRNCANNQKHGVMYLKFGYEQSIQDAIKALQVS